MRRRWRTSCGRSRSSEPAQPLLPVLLNGAPGAKIVGLDDGHDTAIAFVVEDGRISRIYTVRNPLKLSRIDVETTLSR